MSLKNNFSCPICGNANLQALYPKYSGHCITSQMQVLENVTLHNVLCLLCGFIFNAEGTRSQSNELYTVQKWKPKPQVMSFAEEKSSTIRQQESAYAVFSSLFSFPTRGTILDFGAGAGHFLEFFHRCHPQWKSYAIEPGGGYLQHKERIPQTTSYNVPFYTVSLPQAMDVIIVMSVLEHVHNPLQALQWIVSNLADDGVVLMQHPDFAYLPGDLLCADHIGKLTVSYMLELCAHAGLITKEIQQGGVLFAQCCKKGSQGPLPNLVQENMLVSKYAVDICKVTVACVEYAINIAKQAQGKVAVFGTSPVGYMAQYLLDKTQSITCFVDENPATWGKKQNDIPIIAPSDMAKFNITDLALAISPVYWQKVTEKMQQFNVRIHVPSSKE